MNDNHELSLALQRVNKALTAMRSGEPAALHRLLGELAGRDAIRCVGSDGTRREGSD